VNCPGARPALQSKKPIPADPEPAVIEFREPPQTGFELRWSLLGFRFRISPSFFIVYALIIAFLVWFQMRVDAVTLLLAVAFNVAGITIAILFVSLVQALVYRSYGLRSVIVLREFISGVYPEASPPTALQRIAVALAYPAACFLLYALVYYSNQQFRWSESSLVAGIMYLILLMIAMFWGVITLLPVFPYPGGRVLLEVISLASPRNGLVLTLYASIAVGVAYIAYSAAWYFGKIKEVEITDGVVLPASPIVAIFMVLTVMSNWQLLQHARAQRRGYSEPVDDYGDHNPWDRR
jgi:hypothetical protein